MDENKKIIYLNPIERIAYKGLTKAFVGAFMVKDLLDIDKSDDKE